MVNFTGIKEAKTSADKAKIAIEAIREAEKISQSKKGSITKEKFAEMLFPGIPVTGIAKSSVTGITESTTPQPEEVAPRWVHDLVDWLWDLFF